MRGVKGLSKFLSPKLRNKVHAVDIQAAVMWNVAAVTTALWLIQPFDWLKKKLWEEEKKPEPEPDMK